MPDRDKLQAVLRGASCPHTVIPTRIKMHKLQELWEQWDKGQVREAVGQRLTDQMEEIKQHERKDREARVRKLHPFSFFATATASSSHAVPLDVHSSGQTVVTLLQAIWSPSWTRQPPGLIPWPSTQAQSGAQAHLQACGSG